MDIIDKDKEIKLKTEKQDALIAKLIQSSAITKAERDYITNRIAGRLITTKDAGILAALLIAKIQFNKHFNWKRKHKIAECFDCKTKVSLKRYEEVSTGRRIWLCSICFKNWTSEKIIEVKKNKAVDVDNLNNASDKEAEDKTLISSEEKEDYEQQENTAILEEINREREIIGNTVR